jgi:hypothetical protein
LVGIAGEDDIDAPDLKAPMPPASAAAKPTPNKHTRLNGGQTIPDRIGSKAVSKPPKPILGAAASAMLRDQLVEELKAIASSDDAAIWAHRILGTKNSLTEADARWSKTHSRPSWRLSKRLSPHQPLLPHLRYGRRGWRGRR